MTNSSKSGFFFIPYFFSVLVLCFCLDTAVYAQTDDVFSSSQSQPVEVNGDMMEYKVGTNTVVAQGNVSIRQGEVTLYADEVRYNRQTKDAVAIGRVIFESPEGDIWAEEVTYNFVTETGEFRQARLMSYPYFGYGETLSKVGDNHYVMKNGYLTTSDYDEPGYRVTSKRIDVKLEEEAIARGSKFKVGNVPFAYIPKYRHSFKERPRVRVTPGYKGEWGSYVLTAWRYELNEYLNGRVLLDYRERRDVAWGVNGEYKLPWDIGEGSFRTYYMNERDLGDNHLWDERLVPTQERERYRMEIRHDWDIDEQTNFIAQYANLSDSDIIREYFEDEYRDDATPDTFFLLTRALPYGNLSVRSDVRVNRFESKVERLPEVRYSLNSQEIGDTGFYLKSTNTVSNLVEKDAEPTTSKEQTFRVNTNNEISKPFKLSILEMRPFIGSEHTFYSQALDVEDDDTLRSQFKAGLDVSTKFYRIFDTHANIWGMEIDRLRHVITPSAKYLYEHDPTHLSSTFNQFDGIDSASRSNQVTFSLENKLQTKRNDKSVDLVRFVLDAPYYFNNTTSSKWGDLEFDLDIRPVDYLNFYADAVLDTERERFDEFNLDLVLHDPDPERNRWRLGIGKRWSRAVDDQLTTFLDYKINPKWSFTIYERFDLDTGVIKEQEYAIKRDLHSWDFQVWYNDKNTEGVEIMFAFTLKAFPDTEVSLSQSYPEKKSGVVK